MPSGEASQRRAAHPRSANRMNRAACAAIRLLGVESSATTRPGTTDNGSQPSSLAIPRPSRTFASIGRRSPWTSAITVLISTISTTRVRGSKAMRSMLPRSPYRLNVTSTRTIQPPASSRRLNASWRAACPASSSRSSSPPRQRPYTCKSTSSGARRSDAASEPVNPVGPCRSSFEIARGLRSRAVPGRPAAIQGATGAHAQPSGAIDPSTDRASWLVIRSLPADLASKRQLCRYAALLAKPLSLRTSNAVGTGIAPNTCASATS